MIKIQKDFKDLFFSIVLEFSDVNALSVNFKLYEIHSTSLNFTEIYWPSKNSKSSEDITDKIEDAEVLGEGYLKWDGCGNLSIKDFHVCGRSTMEDLGKILLELYDFATTSINRQHNETHNT